MSSYISYNEKEANPISEKKKKDVQCIHNRLSKAQVSGASNPNVIFKRTPLKASQWVAHWALTLGDGILILIAFLLRV